MPVPELDYSYVKTSIVEAAVAVTVTVTVAVVAAMAEAESHSSRVSSGSCPT